MIPPCAGWFATSTAKVDNSRYAVALFVCYGLFVSAGIGLVFFSRMFFLVGFAAAIGVLVLDSDRYTDLAPSFVGVVLLCAGGFAAGWAGFRLLLWTGLPAALFAAARSARVEREVGMTLSKRCVR